MTTREARQSFIDRIPSKTVRKAAVAADAVIGDGPCAQVNYDAFSERACISRAVVARSIRALQAVGLISVSQGPMRVSVLAKADGWRRLDPDDVEARLAQAKKPLVVAGRPRTAAPKRPRRVPEPTDDEPPAVERCEPSLPVLAFMRDWPDR